MKVKTPEKKRRSAPAKKKIEKTKDAPIGALLKKARLSQKLTIPAVSKNLNISESYVRAIETEDLSGLPPLSYTLGFVRSLAHYYKLDVQEVSQQYKEHVSKKDIHNSLQEEFRVVIPQKKPAFNYVLIGSILGGAVILGVLYFFLKTLHVLGNVGSSLF